MLPNINKVKDLSEFKTVNVNVKIQSYQITKNQTYEGQFHQEGYRDEGIILVALYYFSVSQNLKGGNLELKYVKNKEFRKEYGCMDNTFEIKSFFVKEDDMIVFLNRNCEHRINRLESIYPSENSINERKVLVFFICNPEKSCIPTTKNVNYNLKCKSIQKDIAYVKRDEFRNSRFVNEKNKVDYFSDEDIPKKNLILNKDILLQNEINFKVNIKDLTGKKYSISIQPNDSVERLKDLIYLQSTVPQDQMRLIFAGKQLEDYFSLDYYHIENEDSIHLVKRLVGD